MPDIKAPSAKPKRIRRRPQVAKAQILDACERLLLTRGPQDLKVAEIAAESGISHSTIIHHFGSTAQVEEALILRMMTSFLQELTQRLEDAEGRSYLIPEFVDIVFDVFAKPQNTRLIAWLIVSNRSAVLEQLEQPFLRFRQTTSDHLKKTDRGHNADPQNLSGLLSLLVSVAIGEGVGAGAIPSAIRNDVAKGQIRQWMSEFLFEKVNKPK